MSKKPDFFRGVNVVSRVMVVGSINIDMVMTTGRLPRIGETILGENMNYYMGGKGANQAVASARMGLPVKLFASVGDDTFGEKALKHLAGESVDTSFITIEENVFTGLASIFSIDTDNSIVVLPGANMLLDMTQEFEKQIQKGDVVLSQLEVPLATVKKYFQTAKDKGCTTILNPAPFHEGFFDFIELIDIITPNETEFEHMIGKEINAENVEEEMIKWSQQFSTTLVLTRGSEGVSYVENNEVHTIKAHQVTVNDTTGAGDTFNGILTSLLAKEYTLKDAVRYANYGAALSTTKIGAQTGMPYSEELLAVDSVVN